MPTRNDDRPIRTLHQETEVPPDAVAITESFAPGPTPPRSPGQAQPVYVSYAWGGESEALVDEFEKRLPKSFRLIRDKSAMRAGDWISRFIQEIGRADMVLVVLSEKYLRSVYCMRELLYLHDTSQGERATFMRRIVPLIVGDLSCARARDRHLYVEHWEQEHANLNALLKQRDLTTVGEADRRELLAIQGFRQHVSDLLAWVADTLMPQGAELRTRSIDAAISLLRERAATLGNRGREQRDSPAVRPPSHKPVPRQTVGIHLKAVAAIAKFLDLIPDLCTALASQPGVGLTEPMRLAEWLCALDSDISKVFQALGNALSHAVETLRGRHESISHLAQCARDILGWVAVTTVLEGYEQEEDALVAQWKKGTIFRIPLGRGPCVEVLVARWRGGKAEFGIEPSRFDYGKDDITPKNLGEIGFGKDLRPDPDRAVDYVLRKAYQEIFHETAPGRLPENKVRALKDWLDVQLRNQRRWRLVIDQSDLDNELNCESYAEAISAALPQLHLIFIDSNAPEGDVFAVSASLLNAEIYAFLKVIEICA